MSQYLHRTSRIFLAHMRRACPKYHRDVRPRFHLLAEKSRSLDLDPQGGQEDSSSEVTNRRGETYAGHRMRSRRFPRCNLSNILIMR